VNQWGETFTDVKSIKDRTREAREALGLSQIDLAKRAKVSPGTIGNLEAGTRKNPRELLAIAAALQVNAEWLKSGKGPRDAGAVEAAPKVPAGAHAELLAFFDELPPLEQAAVLRDVHDRAARVLGDRILAEKFGVTGYTPDGALPSVYREFERRRTARATDAQLVVSPLTHRPRDADDPGEEKAS
jgi:transcriptional regulator with XRE-family HTH domain